MEKSKECERFYLYFDLTLSWFKYKFDIKRKSTCYRDFYGNSLRLMGRMCLPNHASKLYTTEFHDMIISSIAPNFSKRKEDLYSLALFSINLKS